MALFVFKIIFLVVFFAGAGLAFLAPIFYAKENRSDPNVNRRVTKLRLIGVIIGATGLLIVIILAGL